VSEPIRVLTGILALAALPTASCERLPEPDPEPPPQRIVLISLDTTRADRIGAYGAADAITPTIDALARRGVRFAQAIAPTPMTQPSHATLFTGLDPPAHGLRNNGNFTPRRQLVTLATELQSAGYATAAFIAALVLEAQFGLASGFDLYDDRIERPEEGGALGRPERRADAVIDAAVRWLDTAPDRFFLFVHLFDPHKPYAAPSWYARLRAASDYDAEITFVDGELARLLRHLAQRFPDRSTLVVLTGDHGESLGAHGEPTHSYGIYDATQRVPLIFAGPGVPRGVVVEDVVRLADVAPTILAISELAGLVGASGRDLSRLWSDSRATADDFAYMETLATQLDFGWSPLVGVRTRDLKYIRAPRPELYDLGEDPGELHNLAEERPDDVRRLDAVLEDYLAGMPDPITPVPVDATVRSRLESLGYVVPDPGELSRELGRVGGVDPKDHMDVVAALLRADEQLGKGAPMEAYRELERAGDTPLVSARRARAALAAGRMGLAERHAREAIEGGARTYEAYACLGNALLAQGRMSEAEQAFRGAHDRNAGAPEPVVGLAMIAERKQQLLRAEQLYEQALGARLLSTDAHWMLAALYIEQGRRAEAEPLLRVLDERVLQNPRAAVRLAAAEARVGRHDAANAWLERSGRYYPDSPMLEQARSRLEAR
jgi:arylsulfatase A-like enzyme/Tfp pilus assembly protein PilF